MKISIEYNADSKEYFCKVCKEKFSKQIDCLYHWRTKHWTATYSCKMKNCSFETNDKDLLREHKAKHVKIKCYPCVWQDCDKTFANRSLVDHHIRIVHKNERKFACAWPGCEQSFKRPINLRHHTATHTGHRNYVCTEQGCDMSFRNPGSLYIHRRRHNEQNRFICDKESCMQKFPTEEQLATHMLGHNQPDGQCSTISEPMELPYD